MPDTGSIRGYVGHAEGAPCPTFVVAAESLPDDEAALVEVLARTYRWLVTHRMGSILKFAIVGPSANDNFDLEYRFAQCIPRPTPHFDLRGSCGHSILAAVVVAGQVGWVSPLTEGRSVSVYVHNNADRVECEVHTSHRGQVSFTVRFARPTPPRLADLLLLGEPTTRFTYRGSSVRASVVSIGNPYVFVNASDLGCGNTTDLFTSEQILPALLAIRSDAEQRLGWKPGPFPKVAAIVDDGPGVAARAISVPSWHPTLALTGVICLAAATQIPGSVPHGTGNAHPGEVIVRTPAGGRTSAHIDVDETSPGGPYVTGISVSPKSARFLRSIELPTEISVAAAAHSQL